MKYTDNALNILAAKTFRGIGNAWINKELGNVKDIEVIVELIEKRTKDPINETIFLERREFIRKNIARLGNSCDGITAIGDQDFPYLRGNANPSEKPVALFYKGDLSLLSKNSVNVAVIGVLNPDQDTEIDERKIVELLVNKGMTIVSGLAFGCDSIAHDQTLRSNGATVAILPSPLNNILPARNYELAVNIVENQGLLITEYYTEPEHMMELSSRYIERDRLQALFSDAVVLSASYSPNSIDPNNPKPDSGSRHAMEKANNYGITRAVIYNEKKHIGNPKYDLNRQIIANSKNVIVIDPLSPLSSIDKITYSENENFDLFNGEQGDLFA
ncbi:MULTISPECIES: DNA-processing protein DprA [Avibacterium]